MWFLCHSWSLTFRFQARTHQFCSILHCITILHLHHTSLLSSFIAWYSSFVLFFTDCLECNITGCVLPIMRYCELTCNYSIWSQLLNMHFVGNKRLEKQTPSGAELCKSNGKWTRTEYAWDIMVLLTQIHHWITPSCRVLLHDNECKRRHIC